MPDIPPSQPRDPQDTRPRLLAIDWGTTSLRGVLIDARGRISARRALPYGILQVAPGGFAATFEEHFGDWLGQSPALCLLSGMVGSRQGWHEAPYCPCPAGFEALCRNLAWLPAVNEVPVAIVPGMSMAPAGCVNAVDCVPDVMRGEEIQIIGALRLMRRHDGLLVLPGTHSKWARAQNSTVTGFRTFMTGELFALLTRHSILGRTLDTQAPLDETAFVRGVQRGLRDETLGHLLFGVRALSLFDTLDPAQSSSYLSGLLIGQELRDMRPAAGDTVALIGNDALAPRYRLALAQMSCNAMIFGDEATWAGHQAIYEHWLETAA
ncbi:2-dehydro-3-deoxygalactonokinase [Castellaniella ginsengisoli]|uniref:2-dehydro-3-deoxygalactonokinase n=1 Tax=Castellaniella ginsengisoli TaxID=546114 RepID=A0AB39D3Q4_9BURK